MSKLDQWLFHQITDKDYVYTPGVAYRDDSYDDESTRRFVARFAGNLDLAGKTVLDIGCGTGVLCCEAARRGASRVVGIDLAGQESAERNRRERFPEFADRVSFVNTKGDLSELGGETFDLAVSKDAMEHYDEPEAFVHTMTSHVKPGGELAIGFGPLWKSPQGGHIEFMTRVPWAHLMFSEQTILAERRRFRPGEDPQRWSEIRGGLNQMTYKRFRAIMASTGLEPAYFATNVSDNRAVKVLKAFGRFRPLCEYATVSVYSLWRKPASATASPPAA